MIFFIIFYESIYYEIPYNPQIVYITPHNLNSSNYFDERLKSENLSKLSVKIGMAKVHKFKRKRKCEDLSSISSTHTLAIVSKGKFARIQRKAQKVLI